MEFVGVHRVHVVFGVRWGLLEFVMVCWGSLQFIQFMGGRWCLVGFMSGLLEFVEFVAVREVRWSWLVCWGLCTSLGFVRFVGVG